jgi:hypothetical protein
MKVKPITRNLNNIIIYLILIFISPEQVYNAFNSSKEFQEQSKLFASHNLMMLHELWMLHRIE